MTYKNFIGSVEYSDVDEVFHGKLLGIEGLVSYEGDSVKSLKTEFVESVDWYIAFQLEKGLAIEGTKPNKDNVMADVYKLQDEYTQNALAIFNS
jgi:predicted HicB family RNase H-like nuclease